MKSYQIMLDFKRPDGLNATLTNQVVRLPKFASTFSPKIYLYNKKNCSSIQEKNSMKFLDFFGGFVALPKPRGGSWLPPGRRSPTSPMTFTSQTARVGSTWGGELILAPKYALFWSLRSKNLVMKELESFFLGGGDVQNPNVNRWDILDIETPGPNCQRRF